MSFGIVLRKNTRKVRFDVRYEFPEDKQTSRIRCAVVILDENEKLVGDIEESFILSGSHMEGIDDYSSDDNSIGDGTTGITIDFRKILEKFPETNIIRIIVFQVDDDSPEGKANNTVGDANISIDVHKGIMELARDAHIEMEKGNAFEAIEICRWPKCYGDNIWGVSFAPIEFVHKGYESIKNRCLTGRTH